MLQALDLKVDELLDYGSMLGDDVLALYWAHPEPSRMVCIPFQNLDRAFLSTDDQEWQAQEDQLLPWCEGLKR